MESTSRFYETTKMKHIVYGFLLAAAFSWPWIFIDDGDLVGALCLGMLPVIVIGAFIAFKETKSRPAAYRWAIAVALTTVFLLVWMNGAVGIIGNEANPANLMYFGVLAVGIIGALISRFQPYWMARTFFMMALAQALVPVIALIIWPPQVISWGEAGVFGVFLLSVFFAMLFIVSAFLFRRAAQEEDEPDAK